MTVEKALPASETVKEMVRSFKGFCLKEKSLKEALHKVAKENLSSSIDASAQAPIIWNTLIQPSETSSFVKLISSNEPISGSNNLFTEGLREQTKMLVSSSKSKIAVLAGVISSPPGCILIGLGVGIFTSLVIVPKIRKFLSRKYRGKKILAFETLNNGDFDAIYLRSQGASYALSDFIEFWEDDFFGEKIEPLLNLDPIIERYRVKFLDNLKKRFFEKKRDAKNSHLKNNIHALKLLVVEDLLKEQTQELLFTDDYVISLQESKSALIEIGSKKRENNPLPTETQISISENRVTSKKDLFTDSPPEVIAALEKKINKTLTNIQVFDLDVDAFFEQVEAAAIERIEIAEHSLETNPEAITLSRELSDLTKELAEELKKLPEDEQIKKREILKIEIGKIFDLSGGFEEDDFWEDDDESDSDDDDEPDSDDNTSKNVANHLPETEDTVHFDELFEAIDDTFGLNSSEQAATNFETNDWQEKVSSTINSLLKVAFSRRDRLTFNAFKQSSLLKLKHEEPFFLEKTKEALNDLGVVTDPKATGNWKNIAKLEDINQLKNLKNVFKEFNASYKKEQKTLRSDSEVSFRQKVYPIYLSFIMSLCEWIESEAQANLSLLKKYGTKVDDSIDNYLEERSKIYLERLLKLKRLKSVITKALEDGMKGKFSYSNDPSFFSNDSNK